MMKSAASHIKKIFFITTGILVMHTVLASSIVTGGIDEQSKAKKYSLTNLHFLYKRNVAFISLKNTLLYRGSSFLTEKNKLTNSNSSEYTSIMQFEKGNTTYIMPYKFKVKVPKFKTPTPFNN